jgi:hypothetical protein
MYPHKVEVSRRGRSLANFDKHSTPRCSIANEQAALDMLPLPLREHFLDQS